MTSINIYSIIESRKEPCERSAGSSIYGLLFNRENMKEFYTYEQQLDKLRKDGLTILDENDAIASLRSEGYYNIIKGYSFIFKRCNKFDKGITFNHILTLYEFDKRLRNIVYNYTTSIECHIKALIAHEFSKNHGVDEKKYLTPTAFAVNKYNEEHVNRLISKCQEVITAALDKNSNNYRKYIDHNKTKYDIVPLWVLIRALSFGTTSIFYKFMLPDEQKGIADLYKLAPNYLANMLEVVVSFRNIVAHGERTFCAKLPKTRLSTNLSLIQKLAIEKNDNGDNKYGRNDFLALIICFKYLLNPVEFSGFLFELDTELTTLSKHIFRPNFKYIKILMGLKNDSWKNLNKIKLE